MTSTRLVHNFLTSLAYSIVWVAVPLFLMMSGAFLIRNGRNENVGRFWWHCIKKLGPLSLAFMLLAFFWQTSLWDEYVMGKYGTKELLFRMLRWYGGRLLCRFGIFACCPTCISLSLFSQIVAEIDF